MDNVYKFLPEKYHVCFRGEKRRTMLMNLVDPGISTQKGDTQKLRRCFLSKYTKGDLIQSNIRNFGPWMVHGEARTHTHTHGPRARAVKCQGWLPYR